MKTADIIRRNKSGEDPTWAEMAQLVEQHEQLLEAVRSVLDTTLCLPVSPLTRAQLLNAAKRAEGY